MKELSIQEKAKRYDELLLKLQKAKVDDNVCDEMYYRVINDIVPELKESEDENIRKAIHIYFDWLDGRKDYQPKGEYTIRDMIAWLEKQGEQKQDPCDNCKEVRLNCHNFPCVKKRAFKQGKSALEVINEEDVDNANKVEQNPAVWSEIDEANLEDSIYFVKEFRRSNLCDNESRLQNSRTCIEWLASLKDRVSCEANCITTKEWSVENRSKIQRICKYLDEAKKYYADITEVRECIDWLKSLRPQSTWKPSDEQIKAVRLARSFVVDDFDENPTLSDVLVELEKQLKKLTE
jgi:hypothetical protein